MADLAPKYNPNEVEKGIVSFLKAESRTHSVSKV